MKRSVEPCSSQDGSLKQERLQVFQHALGGRFGSRARFMVLSGEEEVPRQTHRISVSSNWVRAGVQSLIMK